MARDGQHTPSPATRKVSAYVTHRDRLLILRHPDAPEAGLQVPGGTVNADEDPADAVLREAWEETGLSDLTMVAFLGEMVHPLDEFRPGEWQHRFFYHLRCGGEPPAAWRHEERFATGHEGVPIAFDFFWVSLPDGVPELIADQGAFISRLVETLALRTGW